MTAFQTLPTKIVTLVVHYVAFGTANQSDMSRITNEHVNMHALQSLVEVGGVWRQAALECAYSRCEIKMSPHNTFEPSFPLASHTKLENIECVEPFITSLQIEVGYSFLASQENMLATTWKPLLDKKLNNVKHLTIVFSGKVKYVNRLQASSVIAKLAQLIQCMVSSPTQVYVKYRVPRYPVYSDSYEKISSVFKTMYPRGITCEFAILDRGMGKVNLQHCTGLTSIKITWNDNIESRLQIVHTNADTLQTLSVQCKEGDPLDQLFVNSSQDIIVYSKLQRLELVAGGSHKGNTLVHVDVQGAPFPSLCHLKIDMVYPFTSDVLFRENSQTLQYLYIKCGEETLDMFAESGTFANCKLDALKELIVYPAYTCSSTYISPVELAQLTFGIAPSAEHITIEGPFATTCLFEHMPSNIQMKHMTKLSVSPLVMNFCDLMLVLSGMPALKELKCRGLVLGDDLHSYSQDKQIEYVLESCYSLGESFSKVTTVCNHSNSTEDKATALMLTAIMCPKLTFAGIVCDDISDCEECEDYEDYITEAKQAAPFDKFKSQIDKVIIKQL